MVSTTISLGQEMKQRLNLSQRDLSSESLLQQRGKCLLGAGKLHMLALAIRVIQKRESLGLSPGEHLACSRCL